MLRDTLSRLIASLAAPQANGARRSLLGALAAATLGGALVPRTAAAQTAGAACTAGEVGTLRRGTGADANRLLFCTDATLGSGGGTGAAAWCNLNAASATIRGSAGVSSATVHGTGDISVTAATAFPDANYALQLSSNCKGTTSGVGMYSTLGQVGADMYSTTGFTAAAARFTAGGRYGYYADVSSFLVCATFHR